MGASNYFAKNGIQRLKCIDLKFYSNQMWAETRLNKKISTSPEERTSMIGIISKSFKKYIFHWFVFKHIGKQRLFQVQHTLETTNFVCFLSVVIIL